MAFYRRVSTQTNSSQRSLNLESDGFLETVLLLSSEKEDGRVERVDEKFREILRKKMDFKFKVRNILFAVNVLICISLLVALLEIEWDGKDYHFSVTTEVLGGVINLLSFIHFLQLVEYYYQLIQRKKAEARMSATADAALLTTMTILKTSSIARNFCFEALILLPQPIPFVDSETFMPFVFIMFVRLYVIFKVFRDFADVYVERHKIMKIAGYSKLTTPEVNSWLILKTLFNRFPIIFLVLWMGTMSLTLGYALYVFERQAQPELFTIGSSVLLAVSMMLTGWAADTFEEYMPTTHGGKVIAIVCAVTGLFLFALMIDYIHTQLLPTSFQVAAVKWATRTRIVVKEQDAAARLIQIVWRRHRYRIKARQTNINSKTSASVDKKFVNKIQIQIKNCKKYRTQLMQAEDKEKDNNTATEMKKLEKRLVKTFETLLDQQRARIISEVYHLQTNTAAQLPPQNASVSAAMPGPPVAQSGKLLRNHASGDAAEDDFQKMKEKEKEKDDRNDEKLGKMRVKYKPEAEQVEHDNPFGTPIPRKEK